MNNEELDNQNSDEQDLNAQAAALEKDPMMQDIFSKVEALKNPDEEQEHDQYSAQEDNTDHENSEVVEVSDESEEEEAKEPKKRGDKYRKLQNDKYRAIAEKEAAYQKVRELEEMLEKSLSSSTYHYGKNAYTALELAKEEKRQAIREGDEDSLVEADIKIVKALNSIDELEKWAHNSAPAPQQRQQEPEESYNEVYKEIAADWLDSHPYLKPESRRYNHQLAEQVGAFVGNLEDNLHRRGQQDLIFTDDYFNTIDNFITSQRRSTTKSIESLSNVSGVRNNSSVASSRKSYPDNVKLSKDEMLMAKTFADLGNMPQDTWLKSKIELMKEGR